MNTPAYLAAQNDYVAAKTAADAAKAALDANPQSYRKGLAWRRALLALDAATRRLDLAGNAGLAYSNPAALDPYYGFHGHC